MDGKKFDLRVYMLIANTAPFVVLYRKGYVRLCLGDYETDTDVMSAHLTNQVRLNRRYSLSPRHRAGTLCDVLLIVCSFVRLSVCRQKRIYS